jgi:hypothetical protein
MHVCILSLHAIWYKYLSFRGCTGFDGGFEIAEAIGGLGPPKNLDKF